MPQNNPCVTNGLLPPDIYDTNLNTQLTYNIDFDFVAEEDVVVFREQPAGTFTLLTNSAATGATPPNYTINQGVSPAQVTFNAGEAPGGVSLIVGRRTDICDPVVEYQVGAAIRAGDLNASNTQLLHLIQELRSTLGFMINGNNTDPIVPGTGMDLNDLDDVNVGDPVNPDPALLRFNGTEWVGNTVLEDGDAWVANDTTFATTAAGDDRWLQTGGGNFIGGAGINIDTSVAGQATVEIDLDTPSGLETDPAGNTGELRIDVNSGCEIVADGLNAETTTAAIVQTGGTDADPAIRVATTLGTATTNNDLVITGGNDITVTRNSNTGLTIASTATGDTYDLNASDDGDNVDLNLTSGSGTDNSTVQLTAGSGINIDHTSNNEITFSTTSSTALWTNNSGTLQPADNGRNVRVNDGDGNQEIFLSAADGSATFAGGDGIATNNTFGIGSGGNINIRRDTNSNAAIQVRNGTGAAGVGLAIHGDGKLAIGGSPAHTTGNIQLNADGSSSFAVGEISFSTAGLGIFDGGVQAGDGSNLILENDAEDQTVSINADDCTASYTVTLPPTAPTADGQVLSVASGTDDVELEWADGGGGASVSIGTNPPEAAAAGNAGDLWFNDNTGRLFISYTDATPDSQWIDAAPAAQAATPNLQQVCDEGQTTTTGMSIGTDGSGNLIVGSAPTVDNADNAGFEFRPSGRFLSRSPGASGGTVGINNGNTPLWIGPGTNVNNINGSNFVVHANTDRTVELCAGVTASSVSSGDRVGTIRWSAQNGTGLGGQIRVEANQDWTNSVFGSNMIFDVTPNAGGTPEQVLTLRNNGTVRQQGSSSGDRDQFTCGLQDDSNLNQGGNGISLLVSGSNSGGTRVGIRRGVSTSGAASYIQMRQLDNGQGFLYTDNSDILRISNNVNDVGSTSGTAIGTQTSDRRVKKDITSYVGGLDLIEQLNPVNFKYTHGDGKVRAGFIAQDVQSVIPEAVYDTGERIEIYEVDPTPMADLGDKPDLNPKVVGYLPEDEPTKLAMDYVEIIPALVNAVKELSAELKALKEAQ